MNTKILATVFIVVAVVVTGLALVPLALIWAVNTLFPSAAIPINWATWAAMLLVAGVFSAGAAKR